LKISKLIGNPNTKMAKVSGFLRVVKQAILGADGPFGEITAQRKTEIYSQQIIVIITEWK
jgi:hypothetical protein